MKALSLLFALVLCAVPCVDAFTTLEGSVVFRRVPHLQSRRHSPRVQLLPEVFDATLVSAGNQAIDFTLERFKLQSMSTYSTITALIMNACLRLYTSQDFAPRNGSPRKREYAFSALTSICIVSGIFTAVLWNILGIYSREALGMGNNAGYTSFKIATAMYRKWGFRCFLTTCLSFLGSFVLSINENTRHEDKIGRLIFIISLLLVFLGAYNIHTVLQLATRYIYTPYYCQLHSIA